MDASAALLSEVDEMLHCVCVHYTLINANTMARATGGAIRADLNATQLHYRDVVVAREHVSVCVFSIVLINQITNRRSRSGGKGIWGGGGGAKVHVTHTMGSVHSGHGRRHGMDAHCVH